VVVQARSQRKSRRSPNSRQINRRSSSHRNNRNHSSLKHPQNPRRSKSNNSLLPKAVAAR
jgi:hypothetical protein